jgi:hypothetical protein
MTLKEICDVLEHVLLQDGEMDRALYEWEMEEHVDYWTAKMRQNQSEYLIVADVSMNMVTGQPRAALLVLEPAGPISVNEAARDRLKALWKDAYAPNMQKLIPSFAQMLKDGQLPVHGVKAVRRPIACAKTKRSKRRH